MGVVRHPSFLPAVIAVVAAIVYSVGGELGFYEDDWGHVALASSSPRWLVAMLEEWFLSQRPMNGPVLGVLAVAVRYVGMWFGHFLLLLPHVGAAVLVYYVVGEFVGHRASVAFPAALLWLFYPADGTTTVWFFGAIYSASTFFALLAIVLFIRAGGRPAMIAGGCIAYAASLTSVEINVFVVPLLVLGWWLLQIERWGPSALRRVATALAPMVIVAFVHASWWYWLVPAYGIQRKINTFTFDFGQLAMNVASGVVYVAAAPYPVYAKITSALGTGRTNELLMSMVVALAAGAIAIWAASQSRRTESNGTALSASRLVFIAVLGLAVVLAAYLPWCLGNGRPGYFSFRGRASYAPAVGAVLVYAALLVAVAKHRWWTGGGYVLAFVPVVAAAVFQMTTRHEFARGWEHQKRLFSGMATACPDLASDTVVIVDGLGEVNWKRGEYIVSGGWSVAGVLRMLYGRSVRANVYRRDPGWTRGRPSFTREGLYLYGQTVADDFVPYDRVVIMDYDKRDGSVRIPPSYRSPSDERIVVHQKTSHCRPAVLQAHAEREFLLRQLADG